MTSSTLETHKADGILTVTLNRPEKLNAFTGAMGQELADIFEAVNDDDDVRVVIVTGNGRAFCAGADISGGADSFGAGAEVTFGTTKSAREDGRFIVAMHRCLKPIIAALNGPAVGVGITLTLPMDIRIAADTARIGLVFARRGLVPEATAAWYLPRIIGLTKAMRLCYSGRMISAQEALEAGIVSEVVPPENLLDRAREIAREIVEETSPIAVAVMRQMFMQYGNDPDPFRLLEFDGLVSRQLGAGADVREGVAAFIEKRRPNFPGKVSKDLPEAFSMLER